MEAAVNTGSKTIDDLMGPVPADNENAPFNEILRVTYEGSSFKNMAKRGKVWKNRKTMIDGEMCSSHPNEIFNGSDCLIGIFL